MSEQLAKQLVLVERIGNVGLITMNRPQAMNAINADLGRGRGQRYRAD